MATLLGFKPESLTVYLSEHGDFVAVLIYDDGDPNTPNEWPPGTQISLAFYANRGADDPEASWPATIIGKRASWHVPRAQVSAEVLIPENLTARLIYTEAEVTLEWLTGVARDVH